MNFEKLIVGSLDSNCYLLKSDKTGIIIDPGAEPERIIKKTSNLDIDFILATHGHSDHISALKDVKNATGSRAAIHPLDWNTNFDIKLEDGQKIKLGKEVITVIHTPGHTAGGCCFLIDNDLFSGDTLFPGGPGNTSYSGGDEKTIRDSIREKLLILPDETKVHPGHGPSTTIGQEKGLY